MNPIFHLSLVAACAFCIGANSAVRAEDALTSGTEPSPWGFSLRDLTVAGSLADNSPEGRRSYSLNRGWQFVRGGSEKPAADAAWQRVTLPHGVDEALPEEASGGRNYRGPAWYRRHFVLPGDEADRRQMLYFEGVMGRCRVWVNGVEVATHAGGYLPLAVDITEKLKSGELNEILVCADNSDDPSYPPGKPQDQLDFTYFGGIYRDAWLISTPGVHISDANAENRVAGGGIFFRTMEVDFDLRRSSLPLVRALADVHVRNDSEDAFRGSVRVELPGLGECEKTLQLAAGGSAQMQFPLELRVKPSQLWFPENPSMHELKVSLIDAQGRIGDCRRVPVGIRIVKFTPKGVEINGQKLKGKLLGANRHQDYAVLGHAVPNNLQVEDAHKLHDAGIRIIRLAHTPADPAFLDACDRFGMLVIVPTPGWQFCGTGRFVDCVYDDIRNMIRRDRNHPSVVLWEPVLNESHFPEDFAYKARKITHEEYPVPGCAAACDSFSKGAEAYDVLYSHPPVSAAACTEGGTPFDHTDTKAYFTREWGDTVDNWVSHNSDARASRRWGEIPMLEQLRHYMSPDDVRTCWKTLCEAPDWHVGGAMWHSFDHQRGYHPDPFYGGMADAFRQPKLLYYAFMAQRPQNRPMVYIAHGLTPFSPRDVTVLSNCDEVRLTSQGAEPVTLKPETNAAGTMHMPLVFENAWSFTRSKELTRSGGLAQDCVVAEGLIDGKVVCRHELRPARRPAKLRLRVDATLPELCADGCTVVPVVAEVVDQDGHVKRLSNEKIVFKVEGAGEAVNRGPQDVVWGTAPLLVRVGEQPGEIRITASVQHAGTQAPKPAEPLLLQVKPNSIPELAPASPPEVK